MIKIEQIGDLETLNQWVESSSLSGVTKPKTAPYMHLGFFYFLIKCNHIIQIMISAM